MNQKMVSALVHVTSYHVMVLLIILVTHERNCFGLALCRRTFVSKAVAITASCYSISCPIANAATTAQTDTTIRQIIETNEVPPDGTMAPAFTLPSSLGTGETSLKQLVATGKWTVLYFFPAAFTSGCTLQARNFQRDIEQYRSLNAQIVGVSVDPPETNADFCVQEGLDFFMLSDKGGNVSQLYGTARTIKGWGTFSSRQTYIIDPNGNLRYIFAPVDSIPRHSTEVIEKLRELEGKTIA
jgi:thioredoxin-dependent peroxiredoxin